MKFLYGSMLLLIVCLRPVLALDSPTAFIEIIQSDDDLQVLLQWTEVEDADYYGIYSHGPDPYGPALPYMFVDEDQLSLDVTLQGGHFFHVVAAEASIPPDGFLLVHAGTFTMGQLGAFMPEHPVTLTHSFFLARHEVTNQEYLAAVQWAYDHSLVTVEEDWVHAHGQDLLFLGDEASCELLFDAETGLFYLEAATGVYGNWGPGAAYPDGYDPAPHPVKQVSWFGAACYCDWLSLQQELPPFYNGDWSVSPEHDPCQAEGYTLPTEAEWEHAARYQDGRRYPWGDIAPDCDHANFWNFQYCVGWTTPVGSFPAGESYLGFQDMAGNLWEWCNDWWDNNYYEQSPPVDPPGPSEGEERVLRGGFWFFSGELLQSANRNQVDPEHASYFVGFRPRLLAGESGED
ncbi:MAG: SUMF1/EgtB/PvdO family nonheme iron enzyme [Candidatus Delongbacteria bacterium]|nr:SUMF1/EgtB/PvdO family nonheme iron enzyme [Candidatus Delongbacteria bacterium]